MQEVKRIAETELAKGLKLIKLEEDFDRNYEVLDQLNTYTVESKLDRPVSITINLAGSDGATFSGPIDSQSLTKTTHLEPYQKAEVGKVKLKGDWQLKIRFTYKITDITVGDAKLIAIERVK
jgi:hypothetical protein